MIGKIFLCLLIPLKLFGQIESSQNQPSNQELELELDFSKMLSLTIEFPLGLTESNEEMLLGYSAIQNQRKVYIEWIEKHTFPWIKFLIMLGSFGIIWMIYLYSENIFIKLKKKNHVSKQTPILKESIDYFINKQWIEKEQAKELFFELNKLLIIHLEERINLSLNTKTSNEIIQVVLKSEFFNSVQKQNLSYVLKTFEHIKFSGKVLSLTESKVFIEKIKNSL